MKHYLIFLLPALLAASCVTTKIESTKISGFDKKIERVYLKTVVSKENPELMGEINTELAALLEKRAIQVKKGRVSEMDLGEQGARVQEEIALFQPDLILTLKMEGSGSDFTYQPFGGAYYREANKLAAAAGTFPSDQPVWKAILRSTSNLPAYGAPKIARKLVGRLEQDGLLPPLPAKQ